MESYLHGESLAYLTLIPRQVHTKTYLLFTDQSFISATPGRRLSGWPWTDRIGGVLSVAYASKSSRQTSDQIKII